MLLPRITIVIVLGFTSCKAPDAPETPETPEAAEQRPDTPGEPKWTQLEMGTYEGHSNDYAELVEPALAKAKREGKVVILYFANSFSPKYERFRSEVLGDRDVQEWLAASCVFVPLMDGWAAETEVRFHPPVSNTLVLLDDDGREFHRCVRRLDAKSFIEEMDSAIRGR